MNRRQLLGLRNGSASRSMQGGLVSSVLLLLWVLASCNGGANSIARQSKPTTRAITPVVTSTPVPVLTPSPTAVNSTVHHYEYVFPDGGMDVYDIDSGFALVQHVSLPTSVGATAVPALNRWSFSAKFYALLAPYVILAEK